VTGFQVNNVDSNVAHDQMESESDFDRDKSILNRVVDTDGRLVVSTGESDYNT
jgi:hypothetical protein